MPRQHILKIAIAKAIKKGARDQQCCINVGEDCNIEFRDCPHFRTCQSFKYACTGSAAVSQADAKHLHPHRLDLSINITNKYACCIVLTQYRESFCSQVFAQPRSQPTITFRANDSLLWNAVDSDFLHFLVHHRLSNTAGGWGTWNNAEGQLAKQTDMHVTNACADVRRELALGTGLSARGSKGVGKVFQAAEIHVANDDRIMQSQVIKLGIYG